MAPVVLIAEGAYLLSSLFAEKRPSVEQQLLTQIGQIAEGLTEYVGQVFRQLNQNMADGFTQTQGLIQRSDQLAREHYVSIIQNLNAVMVQVVQNGQVTQEIKFQLAGMRAQFDAQHKELYKQDYLLARAEIRGYLRDKNEDDSQLVPTMHKHFRRLRSHITQEIKSSNMVSYSRLENSIPERLLENTHASFYWLVNFAHRFFVQQNLPSLVPHVLKWKGAIDDLVDFLYLTPVFEHNKTQEKWLEEILGDAKAMSHHVIRIKTSKEFFTFLFQEYLTSMFNAGKILFNLALNDLCPILSTKQIVEFLTIYKNIFSTRHELQVTGFDQVEEILQTSSQTFFKEMTQVLALYFYGTEKEKALKTSFKNKLQHPKFKEALEEIDRGYKLILAFIALGFSTDSDLNRKAREQLWNKSDFLEFFQQHPLENKDFFLIHFPQLLSQFSSIEVLVLTAVNLAKNAQADEENREFGRCGYSEIDQTVEKLENCLSYVRARFPVGREENTVVHQVKERKTEQSSFNTAFRLFRSFLVTSPYDPLPPREPDFSQDTAAQSETQKPQTSQPSSDTRSEEDEAKKRELCKALQEHHADFSKKLKGVFGERLQEERTVIQDGCTYGQMVQAHKHSIPMGQYSSVYWDAIKRGIPFQTLQFMSPEAVVAYISDIDQTTIELPEVAQAEERSSELVVLYSNVPEHGEFSFETAVNPRNYEDSYYGFAAFGLSVEKVFDQLSKNAGDLSLRKLMQSDIAVFVRAKMHQQIEMPFDEYQALCQQHKEVQKVKDAFIRELVDDYSWAGDLDSLIALDTYETAFPLPVCKKQKEFFDRINEFKTTVLLPALLKERQLLLAFCLRQDVFEHYIQLFRKRENWYSSCFTNMPPSLFKAIAKLNQISVYYWKRNAKNAFHLDLVCVDDQKSPRMVHLLYDPNQKRLIPLVIKSRPAPVKAYVDDTYCVKDVEELQRLSESGDVKAQAVLGRFFIFGCKVKCNYESAERWSSAAKEQNDSDGYTALGALYLFGPNGQRDPERAVELFRQAAQMGNMQAECYLGEAYLNGWGVETNYSTAIKKFELAAKHHVAEGLVNLAICYREGFGVPQDLVVARHLFEVVLRDYKPIPSNQAVSVARLHLADMYRKGEGEAENLESATEDQKVFELYQEALKEDSLYAFAYFSLGRCYFDGCGTRKNYSLAYKCFETALEKGYVPAASFLGVMAYSGWGVPINYTNAFRWCELASHLPENQQALFYLGLMHLFGLGTEVDREKAKKIFEDPFLEEYAGAIRRLAVMYANTRGPSRDALFAKANGLPTYSSVIRPALAMNSEGDAVIFYEKCEKKTLLYKVGKMQNGAITWGEEKVFGSGWKASVAIDSSGKVVLMYTKHDNDEKIITREGCLKDGSIAWGGWKDEHTGKQASVAIVNTGDNSDKVKMFEVHKSERRDRLHFRIGNGNEKDYDWEDSSGLNGLDGVNPSVGICKRSNGFFVFVAYEDKPANKVHYLRGEITGNSVQWWSKKATFNNVVNPSVFVNDDGKVLLVCRNPSKYDELVYYTGESIFVPVQWSARRSCNIGYRPSAVLDSEGNLFGVCECGKELCEIKKNLA